MAEGNHSFTEQDIRKRFGTTAGPAVHRVADKVELVADGTGDLRSREYHHQTDDSRDQYVLDD